ncbi:hypothetical protein OSB04_012213 [Centaurea solstitialis]|uniref:Integrase catalytic domain-containing protein n=1 Tax=Centaurea solstitialis TaxID=347529 RepID=A0AA38WPT8_9ASTR|nr:hypothetical protein OSB04_012213 [Centaurea solstitialis]
MSKSVIPFYTPEESLRLIDGKWKLTGQNFPIWKMHLDNVLSAQGKLYILEKPVSRPKSNSPEEEFAQYFKSLADESDVMSILIFSISPEFSGGLRDKSCHEVVKDIENQLGFYKHTGKLLIMKEILSLKLKKNQSIKDHLINIRRLFKCLTRLGYKMAQEELMHLMWYSLPKEICDTASAYMKEPRKDVAMLHEDILASLEPKPAPAELMDTDWIDELGDLSCPECGSQDIREHSMNIDQIEIGLPDAPGIFMIDCLINSYESWVIDTGSGNHICNHLQGFTRRETLRKDRSNQRVGEGTPLIAEAVGSYSLSLPSGLVLELENCYYVPKMIKNVLSYDLLVDQGFYYKYDYKMLSVFKNDIFYFKATPVNGLYTVNLQDDNREIYHISKRSKDIEDQTYLWHCRLGHINKKRIETLLKGGFLGTFDYKPFDNCESCLSGKMTKDDSGRVGVSDVVLTPKGDILEPKPAPADLMDTDWIDELGDLSCPECGSKDICEHSMNIDQMEIGLPDAPGSGNHICNHLQGFTRRETLRKDRSNLRVDEGTPLIADAVGSYSLSLPSGLVLELENLNLQDDNKEIYHISKRSKDIEDQTYLWHCRLGHINKKRVELLLKEDQGGEYLSQEFGNHLMECGIVSQLTPPYTPQMNGVSERRNRTLLDMVRSMMCHSTLPVSFWGHALETAAHILNRAPTKSMEKTPYELWKGKKPKMSFLKIWKRRHTSCRRPLSVQW